MAVNENVNFLRGLFQEGEETREGGKISGRADGRSSRWAEPRRTEIGVHRGTGIDHHFSLYESCVDFLNLRPKSIIGKHI